MNFNEYFVRSLKIASRNPKVYGSNRNELSELIIGYKISHLWCLYR